jgi:hypothetical protein
MRTFLGLDGSCKLITQRGLVDGLWVNARQPLRSEPRYLYGVISSPWQSPHNRQSPTIEAQGETGTLEVDPAREAAGPRNGISWGRIA